MVVHARPNALVDREALPRGIPEDETGTLRKLEGLALHGPPSILEPGPDLRETADAIDQESVARRQMVREERDGADLREPHSRDPCPSVADLPEDLSPERIGVKGDRGLDLGSRQVEIVQRFERRRPHLRIRVFELTRGARCRTR